VTLAHLAATRIETTAEFAFAQLSDVAAIGKWALGSMNFRSTSLPEVWQGRSMFDGSDCFMEIRAYPELGLIDYHVGSVELRVPRISIRVTSGENWGIGDSACMVAMTTWRADAVDEAGWTRTCRMHDLEVLLFKAQVETIWNATR